MTSLDARPNGTGLIPVVTIPTRNRRRVLQLASISRRNRRRATWIKSTHTVAGELPGIALVTSIAAAVTIDAALVGLASLLVLR